MAGAGGRAGRLGRLDAGGAGVDPHGARKAVACCRPICRIGEDIDQALAGQRQREPIPPQLRYAGEAALTYPDAAAYFDAYRRAIEAVDCRVPGGVQDKSVSIGLSGTSSLA